MFRWHRIYVLALVLLTLFFVGTTAAFAQADEVEEQEASVEADVSVGDEESEDAAETEDEAPSDDEDLEEGKDLDDDDEDDLEESENAADDVDIEEVDSPDDLELDYDALGEMNPEDELAGVNAVGGPKTIISEDWTQRNLDLFEVHGYFRVRPALYNKFFIRNDRALFPLDVDREAGCQKQDKCKTVAGADMRFLFSPTINLSEEVRVNSELIFFDNLQMGSTPSFNDYGEGTVARGAVMGHSQGAPSNDYFTMNRVWGEMESQLGILRFGRMPNHWGTGMLYNSGDRLNDDLGDSVDRLSFAFKINGWMIMPAFDFPNEGLALRSSTGRPFDVSQLDEGYRIVGVMAYQHEVEDQAAILKRGDWLINTGLHFSYRSQAMTFDWTADIEPDEATDVNEITSYERDAWVVTPDIWFQLLYDTFHLELEFALQIGEVGKPDREGADMNAMKIVSWGSVLQIDYGLLSDQLRIGMEFGIASGDKDVEGLQAAASFDQPNGESSTFSQFSFNPAHGVDMILYRHILGSVSGSYYFKPWLRYDFLKSAMGKNLGVQLDVVFARAMYEESTISNSSANLGLELNARVDFITADRFHASLKYGVLFPLNAFKGTYEWTDESNVAREYSDTNLAIPQTLQLLLGVTY